MIIALSIIAGLIVINRGSNAYLKYQEKQLQREKKIQQMAEALEKEMRKEERSRLYVNHQGWLCINDENNAHYVDGFYNETVLSTYIMK